MKPGDGKADGVIGLARETADALGRLTVEHLRLARLEMKADLRSMVQRSAVLATLTALVIVGYGLGMAGLAIVLGDGLAGGVALVIIGGVHVVVAGVGLVIAFLRLRHTRLLATSAGEMGQTLLPLGLGAPAGAMPAASASLASREGQR